MSHWALVLTQIHKKKDKYTNTQKGRQILKNAKGNTNVHKQSQGQEKEKERKGHTGHETQIGSLVNGLNGAQAGWAPTKRR